MPEPLGVDHRVAWSTFHGDPGPFSRALRAISDGGEETGGVRGGGAAGDAAETCPERHGVERGRVSHHLASPLA